VRFLRASPYSDVRGPRSLQSLPVRDGELEAAVQYYTRVFGFELVDDSQGKGTPAHASALLQRDDVTLGLEENGGDPEQEGAFIGVDNVEAAFAELNANGLGKEEPSYTLDWRPAAGGQPSFYNKLFFVVAPDGLCYCLGQKVLDLVREDLPLMETERWALLPPAESRDAEVHALFNDRAVMLPFLKHLYEIPDDQWCERRQRHRAGFANLDEGPLYMDLLWKETGYAIPQRNLLQVAACTRSHGVTHPSIVAGRLSARQASHVH
jgi:catechol 2,3-dioxygenase-like lactoylglutathione lyase family enzyme